VKLFGLIGYPLEHSFSPAYFSQKFQSENITDCSYQLFPIYSLAEFHDLLRKNQNLYGLNVTIPFKEDIKEYLNGLDETAIRVGAVNTIKITRIGNDFNTQGFNTDVQGFAQSIKPFLATHHQRALILGTGGSSKAVAFILKELGIDFYFVSRNPNHEIPNVFTYEELNDYIFNTFKLIINTTPLGMYPQVNNLPPIPYQYLTSEHFLYDLIYNPIETEFLKKGKDAGALTLNGLDMLKLQAEASWRIWNG